MSGELARHVTPIIDGIAQTLALLEVGIDFSDEDVSILSTSDLRSRLGQADDALADLLADSTRFDRLVHEPTVVLVGRPNAGKSTLFNALAGHDRAVVSPVAGTTRDVLSALVALRRGVMRLLDIAGLDEIDEARSSSSQQRLIELKMREQALRAVAEADRVVLVRDAMDSVPPPTLAREPDLTVWSKGDLWVKSSDDENSRLAVSAKTGRGLERLREELDVLCFGEWSETPALALNARHVRAIESARQALMQAMEQSRAGPEFAAIGLREGMDALGQITGRISSDDLLGRIFSAFCIGK